VQPQPEAGTGGSAPDGSGSDSGGGGGDRGERGGGNGSGGGSGESSDARPEVTTSSVQTDAAQTGLIFALAGILAAALAGFAARRVISSRP
jgi:hypothetical protein